MMSVRDNDRFQLKGALDTTGYFDRKSVVGKMVQQLLPSSALSLMMPFILEDHLNFKLNTSANNPILEDSFGKRYKVFVSEHSIFNISFIRHPPKNISTYYAKHIYYKYHLNKLCDRCIFVRPISETFCQFEIHNVGVLKIDEYGKVSLPYVW